MLHWYGSVVWIEDSHILSNKTWQMGNLKHPIAFKISPVVSWYLTYGTSFNPPKSFFSWLKAIFSRQVNLQGRSLGQYLNPSPYTKTRERVCFSTLGTVPCLPITMVWIHAILGQKGYIFCSPEKYLTLQLISYL